MKKSIIMIDGECNFCNKTALFVIKFDKSDKFLFASQQSETGRKLLVECHYTGSEINTIILLKENQVYTKSTAVIEIARDLTGLPRLLILFKIIPVGVRDFVYDLFSKYRYRLFGKKNKACNIPSNSVRKKFLS